MRLWFSAFAVSLCALQAQGTPELQQAKAELDRIEKLVENGGLARARLDQAREAVAEAEDQALLRQTLYGSLKIEDLSDDLNRRMTESARRLHDRQQARVDHQKKLADLGVVGRISLTPLIEELDARRRTVDMAESRVRLWNQFAEMARAEQQRLAELESEQLEALARAEADPSYGLMASAKLKRLEQEYERTFARALPVSAKGDTGFHRSLGFNHTGRIDVGLNPESSEGRWLRDWLEGAGIPYLAFRGAIRGVSSAPHIHIGPPSTRLRAAD